MGLSISGGDHGEGREQGAGEQNDGVGDADTDVQVPLGGGELWDRLSAEDHVGDEVAAEEEQVPEDHHPHVRVAGQPSFPSRRAAPDSVLSRGRHRAASSS
jgi:hypothetical protein